MRSTLIRPNRALPLLAVLLACLALPAIASAGTTYTVHWGKSTLLENPNKGIVLSAIGCAPTIKGSTDLLCIAGDTKGTLWASEHPARGSKYWRHELVDSGSSNIITGISCPSLKLCVAVDATGQVMHSTDPYGGRVDWSKPVRVDSATQPGGGYAGFAAISCPTAQLCIAVDNAANGQVVYTTNPTGPASAWTLATIGQGVTLSSVACASTTLCVIGGSQRYFSTAPTGGAGAWKSTGSISAGAGLIASLTCNTAKLCLGVGYGNAGAGLATGSSAPATDATAWATTLIGTDPPAQGAGLVDGVACPFRNFCVAVDGASNAYMTSTPVRGGWSAAKPLKKDSQSTVSQVTCNQTMCVEADNRGTVTYGVVKIASSTPSTTSTSTTTTPTATGTTTTKSTSTTKTG